MNQEKREQPVQEKVLGLLFLHGQCVLIEVTDLLRFYERIAYELCTI